MIQFYDLLLASGDQSLKMVSDIGWCSSNALIAVPIQCLLILNDDDCSSDSRVVKA